MIPYHLKVGLPIDDSEVLKCLFLALRKTSSKRNLMLQTGRRIRLTHRLKIGWPRLIKYTSSNEAIEQTNTAKLPRNVHGNYQR